MSQRGIRNKRNMPSFIPVSSTPDISEKPQVAGRRERGQGRENHIIYEFIVLHIYLHWSQSLLHLVPELCTYLCMLFYGGRPGERIICMALDFPKGNGMVNENLPTW